MSSKNSKPRSPSLPFLHTPINRLLVQHLEAIRTLNHKTTEANKPAPRSPSLCTPSGESLGQKGLPHTLLFIKGLGPSELLTCIHSPPGVAESQLSVRLLVRQISDLCQKRCRETSSVWPSVSQIVPGKCTIRDCFLVLKLKCFHSGLCCC